jgi:hypothetical protein
MAPPSVKSSARFCGHGATAHQSTSAVGTVPGQEAREVGHPPQVSPLGVEDLASRTLARRGRGRSFRGGGGSRRRKVWARQWGEDHPAVGQPGTPVQTDLLGGFGAAMGSNEPGMTLARVVGSFYLTYEAGSLAGGSSEVGIGLLSSSDLINAGIGPMSNEYVDWFYHQQHHLYTPSVGGELSEGGGNHRWDIDLRSMRKLDEIGDSLWLVTQTWGTGSVTVVPIVNWSLNMLMLLP